MSRRTVFRALIGLALALVAIQLVPFGRAHENPPVRLEPRWDAPETRALADRACFDCHSNQTDWPTYSFVAPISWVVTMHVAEGRAAVNFSEWDHPGEEAEESAEVVQEGEMPPAWYTALHPEARLTAAERERLIRGLQATIGGDGAEVGENED